jgi:hypothetical protein
MIIPPRRIGNGTGIAADGSVLWILAGSQVARLSQASLGVTGVVRAPVGDQGQVAVADGRVWVTSTRTASVLGIDPTSLRIVSRIAAPTGQFPTEVVAGNGGLWAVAATNGTGRLLVMDPMTPGAGTAGSVIADIPLTIAPRLGLTVCSGAAWVDDGSRGLLRADPSGTQTLFAWDRGHSSISDLGGGELSCAADSLWQIRDGGVVQLSVGSGSVQVAARVEIKGEAPVALAGSGNSLWVMTDTGSTNARLYYPDPKHPSTVVRIDALHPEAGPSLSAKVGLAPAWLTASGDRAWVLQMDGLDALRWNGG